MSDYVLGSDAVLDLEDIWDYIAADNVVAADRWAAKLFDAFEGITRMPGIGHRREELTAYPVLFWTVGDCCGRPRLTRHPIASSKQVSLKTSARQARSPYHVEAHIDRARVACPQDW